MLIWSTRCLFTLYVPVFFLAKSTFFLMHLENTEESVAGKVMYHFQTLHVTQRTKRSFFWVNLLVHPCLYYFCLVVMAWALSKRLLIAFRIALVLCLGLSWPSSCLGLSKKAFHACSSKASLTYHELKRTFSPIILPTILIHAEIVFSPNNFISNFSMAGDFWIVSVCSRHGGDWSS